MIKIQVQAINQKLSSEEIKSLVPPQTLKRIEGKGVLQAYTLAHEGVSHPRVIGEGKQSITWPAKIIQALAKAVKAGTKFFLNHGETNSHEGRKPLGEIVASTLKNIAGKVSNVVIGWFPDKEKVNDLDVVSMEANVYTDEKNIVQQLGELTGIAMASSNTESPAFPGAVKLAAVQCFEEKEPLEKGEKTTMETTFDQVKTFIRDKQVWPHQLFDDEVMQSDRKFGKLYENANALQVEIDRLKKENTSLNEQYQSSIKDAQKAGAKEILDNLTKEGFTEKQRDFIHKEFNPETMEDLSEEGLKTFVEEEAKKYAEYAKIFSDSQTTGEGGPVGGETTRQDSNDPVTELLEQTKE